MTQYDKDSFVTEVLNVPCERSSCKGQLTWVGNKVNHYGSLRTITEVYKCNVCGHLVECDYDELENKEMIFLL